MHLSGKAVPNLAPGGLMPSSELILAGLTSLPNDRQMMDRIYFSSTAFMIIGIIMLAFGCAYPHFLNTKSFIPYLYATPTGSFPAPRSVLLLDAL
jgi:hypothetical protein